MDPQPARRAPVLTRRPTALEQSRVTAWAIRAARQWQGMTRAELAEQLMIETGQAWTVHMVAKVEAGGKQVTVEHVAALCRIQGRDPGWYISGPDRAGNGYFQHTARDQGNDTPVIRRSASAWALSRAAAVNLQRPPSTGTNGLPRKRLRLRTSPGRAAG